jgi:hypothetical protein
MASEKRQYLYASRPPEKRSAPTSQRCERVASDSSQRVPASILHGAGHLDICKHNANVDPAFNDRNSSVTGFDHFKTGIPDHFGCLSANQEFVLNYQYDGTFGWNAP